MVKKQTYIPVSNIVPLVFREGASLLELIHGLAKYVQDTLEPSLQHVVDNVVAEVESQMDQAKADYVAGVEEFQRIHDAFMDDVESNIAALNDIGLSTLLNNTDSHAYNAVAKVVQSEGYILPLHLFGYESNRPSTHTRALQDGLNAASETGRPLQLPEQATLKLDKSITVYRNTTLLGNGSTLQWDTSPGKWVVTAYDVQNVHIEHLNLSVNGEANRDQAGLTIRRGENIRLDHVSFDAGIPVTGRQSIYDNGLSVRESHDVELTNIHVKNWAHPVYLGQSERVAFKNFELTVVRSALQLIDIKNVDVINGHIHTNDGSHIEQHGGLGVLIESKDHGRTDTIYFKNVVVHDTASHGFRIGGKHQVLNITYDHCEVANTTRGGFKTMGGLPEDNNFHENIKYLNCRVYDCGQEVDNSDGFQIELTKHVVVDNPIVGVRKREYSTGFGISIKGCHDVVVNNPEVSGSRYAAIAILPQRGDLSDITINGGHLRVWEGDGIRFDGNNVAFRRNKILGYPTIETSGNGRHAFVIRVGSGDNGVVSGNPVVTAYIPYSGTSVIDPYAVDSLVMANLIGKYRDTIDGKHFRNGSTWQDVTNSSGGYYVKLHSSWHRLGE